MRKVATGMQEPARTRLIRVLHVGPGHGQRGGIASVLGELMAQRDAFANASIQIAFFGTHGFRKVRDAASFAWLDVARFLRDVWSADVIHFHVSERGSFYRKLFLCRIAKLCRRRVVFHLHSGNFDRFTERAGPLTRMAIEWFVGSADATVGVSEAGARVLNRFRNGAGDAHVIANTAVDAQNAPMSTMAVPDRTYIAFAGRLSEQKGLATLIEALAALNAMGRSIDLVMAGDGDTQRWHDYAETLRVADNVRFAGWLAGSGKSRFYREALLFCLPSRFESFGIAALEAMFYGVPVVATRVGGLAELVDDGVTGYLVEPDDAPALARAMHAIASDPALRERMGRAARERAQRLYAAERVVARYVDCYRQIVGRS
ncbi:glycosyltransferase family 4 protein [Burkholderia sp. AU19243]|uniref:glycosyltransferase family 4 protein n=1 Tax=Burkholderia TaxID=32008 RepID=UPI000841CFC3|nr:MULTISPECIES: glycosyltransferase family 4 protein [Burkholderia]MBR8142496.1 glycosyltransferase family 4 protein [Burkholderia vietnamiensis]AOK07140.1 glycosyl transferase family 1 [Burkholderia latens]MBR8365298.1 glycosyltransferase family 4 protein [Burkholderia sp. AU19243]MCA8310104.1 glycosyltransferase family 4 protein [Burkholderia sp. AU28942]QTO45903.1 glycosyltransferase family 4 protein [Burkholderia latens]